MAITFGSVTRCDIDKVTYARHFVCWPLFPSLPVRRKGIRLGDAWPSATPSGPGAQRCRPSAASIASVSGDACTSCVLEDMYAREVCDLDVLNAYVHATARGTALYHSSTQYIAGSSRNFHTTSAARSFKFLHKYSSNCTQITFQQPTQIRLL